jgi:hypothetical protein
LSHSLLGLRGVRWALKISVGFEEGTITACHRKIRGKLLIVVELAGDFKSAGESSTSVEVHTDGFGFPMLEIGAEAALRAAAEVIQDCVIKGFGKRWLVHGESLLGVALQWKGNGPFLNRYERT